MRKAIVFNGYRVPYKCRHVLDALNGRLGATDFVADNNGKWRYFDLIEITGRNSSERKLRELIEACPGLVSQETVKGRDGGFKMFWLTPACDKLPIESGRDGVLFTMPGRGRPE